MTMQRRTRKGNGNRPKHPSRRQFLRTAASLAVAAGLNGNWAVRAVHGGAGESQISLGVIGCGGRGTAAAVQALSADAGVRVTAMADLFPDQLEKSLARLSSDEAMRSRVNVPPSNQFTGFNAFAELPQTGVDVVLLAAPTGFRPQHFEAAVAAGKHVFMEKAIAVDAPGVHRVLAANELAKSKGLQVAVGFQNRHNRSYAETVAKVRDGAIGSMRKMEVYCNMRGLWMRLRQPDQSEMEYQLRNWLYFVWLSGDIIVELLTHRLDICNWATNDHPARAKGTGGRREFNTGAAGDVFDHFTIAFAYRDGTPLAAEVGLDRRGQSNQVTELLHGEQGTAEPIRGTIQGSNAWTYSGKPFNAHQEQQNAYFSALRRSATFNEVDSAATATLTAIMGRMAAYMQQEVTWEDVWNSREAFEPNAFALTDDAPPTLPDKFGDYAVPARGRVK